MIDPNTAPATGMMTLEQGVAAFKAKQAARAGKPDDGVLNLNEDGTALDDDEIAPEVADETAPEENTEAVSEGESEADVEIPLSGKISMPDGSTITAEEARKGYLRQADFTRKTQATAQKERELLTREQALTQQLGGLIQQVTSLQERPPTPEQWNQMASEMEPKDFQRTQAYWQNRQAVLSDAQRTIQANNARALQAEKAQAFEALNSGTFDPAWKDAGVLKKALDTVSDYWIERGLPPDILAGVSNPTIIEVVEESRRYRELQKAKPKAALAVKGKPQPFKPGAKSTASPQSENLRLLKENFHKNPTVDNAVAYERAKAGR